jgi:hypothetical protein
MVVEVKATGSLGATAISSSPGAACQVIPPASGFNFAFSCAMNGSLAPRKNWVITVNHRGPAGNAVKIVSKTTPVEGRIRDIDIFEADQYDVDEFFG